MNKASRIVFAGLLALLFIFGVYYTGHIQSITGVAIKMLSGERLALC